MPPNPLRPIQQAASQIDGAAREVLERLLHMTSLDESALDFGRSVSSIDDLTKQVTEVVQRVDHIDQSMEQILPLLERLVTAAEDLQEEIAPLSALASKIPGSGSRRRRRERQRHAALPSGDASTGSTDDPPSGP